MSYNIDHVGCLRLDARMKAVDIVVLSRTLASEMAEGNFIDDHLDAATTALKAAKPNEIAYVELEGLDWFGEFSGTSWELAFVEQIAPLIQGHVEGVCTWEGGDSVTGFAIDDGVYVECEVVQSLKRPKPKVAKAKSSAKGKARKKTEDVEPYLLDGHG